jgi:predicted negative regulator of RcsB-dependent stress response
VPGSPAESRSFQLRRSHPTPRLFLGAAADSYERALSTFRTVGDRWGEAETLNYLGDVRHAVGELLQAREDWQQALAILDDQQHPHAVRVRAKLASMEP